MEAGLSAPHRRLAGVRGPIITEADLKKREGLYPANADDPAEVRACLKKFITRAWRRPPSDAEVERYASILIAELVAGENLRSAYLGTHLRRTHRPDAIQGF